MTELVTWDLAQADPIRQVDRATLLAAVGGSVLHLLASAPTPPRSIRVTARDIAVELEFPAAHQPAPVDVDPPPAGDHRITSPSVGTFRPAAVAVGDPVRAGQRLAAVETMKQPIPVEAEVDGRITEVLKTDGQPVEFGEPLFTVEPE